MADDENWLLSLRLRALAEELSAATDEASLAAIWRRAQLAIEAAGATEEAEVALPILDKSLPELLALFAAWDSGRQQLPSWDQAVLKRALKAFRRRLDLARSDDEYSSSRNPLSKGVSSSISGVRPPDRYPSEVWDVLVMQGKLRDAGDGILELATV